MYDDAPCSKRVLITYEDITLTHLCELFASYTKLDKALYFSITIDIFLISQ